jgi:hypothetical protein
MKRSEMLKIMIDHMWNPPKEVSEMCDGGQQSMVMISLLLDKIEEAGMLPPSDGRTIECSEDWEDSLVWEPEDERA